MPLLQLSLGQPEKASVCVFIFRLRGFDISDVTVDGAEARKSSTSLFLEVSLGPCVDALDQDLLIEEGVVGPQRAGGIIISLVVVAQVGLPHGGNVLVHMHLLAQRHHQENACNANRKKEHRLVLKFFLTGFLSKAFFF